MPGMREAFGLLRSWREPDTACSLPEVIPGDVRWRRAFFVPGEARGIPRAGLRSQAK